MSACASLVAYCSSWPWTSPHTGQDAAFFEADSSGGEAVWLGTGDEDVTTDDYARRSTLRQTESQFVCFGSSLASCTRPRQLGQAIRSPVGRGDSVSVSAQLRVGRWVL